MLLWNFRHYILCLFAKGKANSNHTIIPILLEFGTIAVSKEIAPDGGGSLDNLDHCTGGGQRTPSGPAPPGVSRSVSSRPMSSRTSTRTPSWSVRSRSSSSSRFIAGSGQLQPSGNRTTARVGTSMFPSKLSGTLHQPKHTDTDNRDTWCAGPIQIWAHTNARRGHIHIHIHIHRQTHMGMHVTVSKMFQRGGCLCVCVHARTSVVAIQLTLGTTPIQS